MEINHILWKDIQIVHIKNKKEVDKIKFATFDMANGSLAIRGYDYYNSPNNMHHLYTRPKIIKLTPVKVQIEAFWWGTSFKKLKNGKTKMIKMPEHKVIITAMF